MKTIKRGDAGQEVDTWQRILGITPDGVFGRQTEEATKKWQLAHGLTVDGIVGPKTWASRLDQIPDTERPPPALIRGIDVSVMQGVIPWDVVAKADIRFAIMRCAIGNEPRADIKFAANVAMAKKNGIVPGAYCFVFPLPHLDPRAQARHHVRLMECCGALMGELVPMADLEWPPREEWKINPDKTRQLVFPWKKWGCTAEQIAEWCLTYLDETYRLTGLRWLRYTYRYWAACVEMHKYPEFAEGPLCLADYWASGRIPTVEEAQRLKPLAPWTEATIIQHDGNGGLRLPNGVDSDFNVLVGGEAALTKLSSGSNMWSTPPEVAAATVVQGDVGQGITETAIRHYRSTRFLRQLQP